MDRLAAALGLDPVELRLRNAMVDGLAPADRPGGRRARAGRRAARAAARDAAARRCACRAPDVCGCPAASANVTHGEGVRRGVGYAVGFKNIGFSEGFDDYSTARVRLSIDGRRAAGRGAHRGGRGRPGPRHRRGADRAHRARRASACVVLPADTAVGSAGSSSASRQTWMTGGAVKRVRPARARVLATRSSARRAELAGGEARAWTVGRVGSPAARRARSRRPFEHHHRPTSPLDPETGQGDAHVAVRVLRPPRGRRRRRASSGWCAWSRSRPRRTSGAAINPQAVEGQIEGGIAQGLGLALMEEIQVVDGARLRNASFTDYLIPTILDMPPVRMEVLELGDPTAPYGLRRASASRRRSRRRRPSWPRVRAATGRALARVPVRPDDIVLGGR